MTTEDADEFHLSFTQQQDAIIKKLENSNADTENLVEHFSELNLMLQNMRKLYSSSSPYLRIYYRKIYQDALQDLEAKIINHETMLMPRKKFVFKGNKSRLKADNTKNVDTLLKLKDNKLATDVTDASTNCVIQDRSQEKLVISSEESRGKTVLLSRLRGCTVLVTGAPNTVYISDVEECKIGVGPVTTSVFVESAHHSTFQLACQQLRIHQTTSTDFFIHVTSRAIIEDCRAVRFGTYALSYPTLDKDFEQAKLNRELNNWKDIDDFNWLVTGQSSPNWSLIESDTR